MTQPPAQAPADGDTLAVLCNPLSGAVRKRADSIQAAARALGGSLYHEVTDLQEIEAALVDVLERTTDTLCVIGGDGTLQAVLSALTARIPGEEWPRLAVVPGGTTNMSIRDFGVANGPLERLAAFEAWRASGSPATDIVRRPVLRVERPDGIVQAGMFLGGGAVAAGVQFFHRRLSGSGLEERHTSGLAIARILLGLAFGGKDGRAMAPPMECTVDGRTIRGRESVLCVVSTLDRLILGTRPHWGAEATPLHFTLVERHSRRFWRNLPRLARGEPGTRLTPDNGYHSHNAASVDLSFAGPYVIDGELFTLSGEEGPLRISAVTGVRWVVP